MTCLTQKTPSHGFAQTVMVQIFQLQRSLHLAHSHLQRVIAFCRRNRKHTPN